MPGHLDDGDTVKKFKIKDSQAYCDGMAHRASGTAAAKPITDNPWDNEGSERETAWDAGWTAAHAEAGGTISADEAGCCNLGGTSVSA